MLTYLRTPLPCGQGHAQHLHSRPGLPACARNGATQSVGCAMSAMLEQFREGPATGESPCSLLQGSAHWTQHGAVAANASCCGRRGYWAYKLNCSNTDGFRAHAANKRAWQWSRESFAKSFFSCRTEMAYPRRRNFSSRFLDALLPGRTVCQALTNRTFPIPSHLWCEYLASGVCRARHVPQIEHLLPVPLTFVVFDFQ